MMARRHVLLGGLLLLALAGCSEARRDRPGRPEKTAPSPAPAPAPAAPAPAPAPATPVAAPAPIADPAATPAPEAEPLTADRAKGTSLLQMWLPAPRRLGGFALAMTWDPQAFVLGEPQIAAGLKGYMCQPNLATPGQLRFNCVGLPNEDRGGLLASIPVSWRDRAPVVADFKVVQQELVDDRGAALPEARLEFQVAAPGP